MVNDEEVLRNIDEGFFQAGHRLKLGNVREYVEERAKCMILGGREGALNEIRDGFMVFKTFHTLWEVTQGENI